MKKKPTQHSFLLKRLAGYSAAAGTLITLSSTGFGQIIYSGELNMDVGSDEPTILDLNDDGVVDFLTGIMFDSTHYTTATSNVVVDKKMGMALFANQNSTYVNSWLGSWHSGVSYYFPAALGSNSDVSNAQAAWINNDYGMPAAMLHFFRSYTYVLTASTLSYQYTYGNFRGGTNFLGVRFHIGSSLHYGWVRVMINEVGDEMQVLDWAYNSDAGEGMMTGFVTPGFDNDEIYYSLSVSIGVNFDSPIDGLAIEDLDITGGSITSLSVVSPGTAYTLAITAPHQGIVKISLPPGRIEAEDKVVAGAEATFALISLDLQDESGETMQYYPNPVVHELHISLDAVADISVINTLGQTLITREQFREGSLDVSSLTPGTYTLMVKTGTGILTKRFIKN